MVSFARIYTMRIIGSQDTRCFLHQICNPRQIWSLRRSLAGFVRKRMKTDFPKGIFCCSLCKNEKNEHHHDKNHIPELCIKIEIIFCWQPIEERNWFRTAWKWFLNLALGSKVDFETLNARTKCALKKLTVGWQLFQEQNMTFDVRCYTGRLSKHCRSASHAEQCNVHRFPLLAYCDK